LMHVEPLELADFKLLGRQIERVDSRHIG